MFITEIKTGLLKDTLFNFKGGNLRKEQEFICYPVNQDDKFIYFQSDKRWMQFDLVNKKLQLSKKGHTSWLANYFGFIDINNGEGLYYLFPLLTKISEKYPNNELLKNLVESMQVKTV